MALPRGVTAPCRHGGSRWRPRGPGAHAVHETRTDLALAKSGGGGGGGPPDSAMTLRAEQGRASRAFGISLEARQSSKLVQNSPVSSRMPSFTTSVLRQSATLWSPKERTTLAAHSGHFFWLA